MKKLVLLVSVLVLFGLATLAKPAYAAVPYPQTPVVPGTDMTAAQLRTFYSVASTSQNFPSTPWNQYCKIYKTYKAFFNSRTDTYMFGMVTLQESYGYDIPTAAVANSIGWLTDIC